MDRVPSARLISWYSSSPFGRVLRDTIDEKLENSFWVGFRVAFSLGGKEWLESNQIESDYFVDTHWTALSLVNYLLVKMLKTKCDHLIATHFFKCRGCL